ncbi:metal-dependent transcriptional regulator [Buchananella felis]|uniref:metal-dependent transcriptional regulator n=1 Tax=Buchananella felis TaxID=3231492 RepID=UPI003528866B
MSDLIDTTEMYLKTIYEMEEDGVPPLRARIVERLGHSGPTVSQTVARMERDGLLVVAGDRRIQLTDRGREVAREVMLKHRVAERLLLDVIGMPWELVHDEACRWEHVMSDQVRARLDVLLKNPLTDPYGNPLPGHESAPLVALPDALEIAGERVRVRLARLGEPVQAEPGLLREFLAAGILPGTDVTLMGERHGGVIVGGLNGQVTLNSTLAKHVFAESLDG